MHYTAAFGYGLFLSNVEFQKMARAYAEVKGYAKDDIKNAIGDLRYTFDPWEVSRENGYDECKIECFGPKGKDREGQITGWFFPAEKQGSPFRDDKGQFYHNIFDMAREFETHYGVFLPKGFDYLSHLCLFSGARAC